MLLFYVVGGRCYDVARFRHVLRIGTGPLVFISDVRVCPFARSNVPHWIFIGHTWPQPRFLLVTFHLTYQKCHCAWRECATCLHSTFHFPVDQLKLPLHPANMCHEFILHVPTYSLPFREPHVAAITILIYSLRLTISATKPIYHRGPLYVGKIPV